MDDPLPRPDVSRAALLFRLLSDPTRLRLLLALADGGEVSVGQLAAASGRPLSVVSNHLRPLRVAGVVALRRDGRLRLYRLTSEPVRRLLGLIG
jgi:DNA-binding transcriptional ArsR family regulator